MYVKDETLECSKCKKIFVGRRPPEDINILCPECLAENELPIVNEGQAVSEDTQKELDNGGGENGK